jgi:hypothetical protein
MWVLVNDIDSFMGEVHMPDLTIKLDPLVLIVVIKDAPIVLCVMSVNQDWILGRDKGL